MEYWLRLGLFELKQLCGCRKLQPERFDRKRRHHVEVDRRWHEHHPHAVWHGRHVWHQDDHGHGTEVRTHRKERHWCRHLLDQ